MFEAGSQGRSGLGNDLDGAGSFDFGAPVFEVHRHPPMAEGYTFDVEVLDPPGSWVGEALDRWMNWARRSRLEAFVELAHKVISNRAAIEAAMDFDLSNALIESTNTKIRLLTRIAYGFHGPKPLMAVANAGPRRSLPDPPRAELSHGSIRRAK